jgi:hypothetical protein
MADDVMLDPRQYPQGKLTDHDEGVTEIAMAIVNGAVVIKFSKRMWWIGLDAASARSFGEALIEKADELEGDG